MHAHNNVVSWLSFVLLWCCLAGLTIPARAALAGTDQETFTAATTSYPYTQYIPHRLNSRPWLSRVRDRVVKSIWRLSPSEVSTVTSAQKPKEVEASPAVLARYGGDVVLRFKIKSQEEARALSKAVNVLFLDVWEFTAEWVDVRLSKDVVSPLLNLLPGSLQHAHTPLMHDLAQAIYESYPAPALTPPLAQTRDSSRPFGPELRRQPEETNIFFRDYQPLSVIVPWMRLLRSLFPTHVRLVSIGTSYEGRDIPAIRVGVHPTNDEQPSEPRKTIIVTGGSHAREWITTSTVNYVAYSFITAYGKDRGLTQLLEKFDFVFIPTLNPDGYAYTWESDRLWRKNRQQTALRFCRGLDLDRAYGFQWDSSASSIDNPCSESFAGEGPFEAVEARRFADWVNNETLHNNVQVEGFLDLHSYSQQVLYPYSYSCTSTPANLETLEELAIGLAKAIRVTHGQRYDIASACEGSLPPSASEAVQQKSSERTKSTWPTIETRGGSALDWIYHEMGVPFAYQLKLRDTGSYGFLLPKEEIVPTGKEITKAVEYFGNFLGGKRGIEDDEGDDLVKHTKERTKGSHPKVDCDSEMQTPKIQATEEDDQDSEESSDEAFELRRRRRR